jgi:hypothetical protein
MGSLKKFTNLLAHVSADALPETRARTEDRPRLRRLREQGRQAKLEFDCRG